MAGYVHGLNLFDMDPAISNNLISSFTNFCYFNGIRYGLHSKGGSAIGILI